MKKLNSFLTLLILFVGLTGISIAAEKVVLLEQFTGAWCGYCPDGSLIMDQIIEDNPGKVIGVKIHNGDAMAIPEEQILSQSLGNTGYPSGMTDRMAFNVGGNTAFFIDRSAWTQTVSFALQQPAPVALTLEWFYNESTQTINATITGNFDQTINEEIRFNVYVLEDNIPAVGTGYAQRNYYNNTPGHPMYQKGDPITNYSHMKVVRAMAGGAWGQENSIPIPVASGSKISYSFSINKDANWNINNIHLIGTVQYFTQSKRQIINSTEGVKFVPKTQITSTGQRLFAIPQGTPNNNTITIKNTSTTPIEYEIKTENSNSSWALALTPNETTFLLQPGASKTIDIAYTPNSIGSGTAKITVEEIDGHGFPTIIKGYTSDAEFVQVNTSTNDYGIINTIKSLPDFQSILPIPTKDFEQLYSNFNTLQIAYLCLGEDGTLNTNLKTAIEQMINNNVNVLITGPLAYNTMHAVMPSVESQLGFSYIAPEFSGQNIGTINLAGVDGDPISSGFSSIAQLTQYLPMKVRITNPATTFPVITIASRKDTILGTRTELASGTRAVVYSFNVAKISNETQKTNLIKNTLNWLLNIQSNTPVIALSANTIDFGEVETDSSTQRTITIQNKGTGDLIINSANITNDADNSFELVQAPASSIAPGGSSEVIIKFAPKDIKLYLSPKLEIVSNDPINSTMLVSLRGRGTPSVGISRDILSYFNVTPNVVSNTANINFAISSPVPQNVKIYLMDLSGRKIADIQEGTYSYGEYKLNFSSANLNSSTYFVVAEIGNNIETIRINIVR